LVLVLSARAPHGRLAYGLQLVVVAAAYVATGKFGLSLAFASDSVTAIWAPSGIALAALVLGGYRLWPAVALGALLTNLDTGVPAYVVLGITLGNTLEALAGAFLLRHVAFRSTLERLRDVIALIGLAAIASTAVAATIGTLTLLASGELSGADYGTAWRTWWLGDMGGDLLIAPAILVAATHWPYSLLRRRLPEAVAVAATIGVVGAVVFSQDTPVTYVTFPPLIWAALRLEQVGAAAGSLILGAIAVGLTESGSGPFAMSGPDDRLLLAQTFVAVGCAVALVLAAVRSERRRVEDRAQGIATTLQASLLPRTLPSLPGIESAAYFRAAGEGHRVGGDFYDVFELPEGRWGLIVGDVRGKGAKAAAITALVRYTVRNAALVEGRPSRLLELVHDAVLREYGGDEFCTAVCASFELDGPAARVTVSSGGHPLPLAVSPRGEVTRAGAPGMLLGTSYQPLLDDQAQGLRAGDSLVFYTDGLMDAYAPGRVVAESDLQRVMGVAARKGPEEMIAAIRSGVLGNGPTEPRDDIAIVALRFAGEAALE
jgi:integral membrane sensor domain MASE1